MSYFSEHITTTITISPRKNNTTTPQHHNTTTTVTLSQHNIRHHITTAQRHHITTAQQHLAVVVDHVLQRARCSPMYHQCIRSLLRVLDKIKHLGHIDIRVLKHRQQFAKSGFDRLVVVLEVLWWMEAYFVEGEEAGVRAKNNAEKTLG
jgi:hypothetical protein